MSDLENRIRRRMATIPPERVCPRCGELILKLRRWHVPRRGEATCLSCSQMGAVSAKNPSLLVHTHRQLVIVPMELRLARINSNRRLEDVGAIIGMHRSGMWKREMSHSAILVTPLQSKRLREMIGVRARLVREYQLEGMVELRNALKLSRRNIMRAIGMTSVTTYTEIECGALIGYEYFTRLLEYLAWKRVRVDIE